MSSSPWPLLYGPRGVLSTRDAVLGVHADEGTLIHVVMSDPHRLNRARHVGTLLGKKVGSHAA